MALDAGHALRLCKRHELVLKIFLALCHYETYVHHRTVFCSSCSAEHAVSVYFTVEKLCLCFVDLLDRFYAALLFQPAKSFIHHINREYRRSVEHRTSVDMCLQVEHGRDVSAYLSEKVLLYDEECHTRRTDVLLSSAVDHSVFAYIHRTAHDVR